MNFFKIKGRLSNKISTYCNMAYGLDDWIDDIYYIIKNLYILYWDTYVEYLSYFYFVVLEGRSWEDKILKWWKPKYKFVVNWDALIPDGLTSNKNKQSFITFGFRTDANENMRYKNNSNAQDDTPLRLLNNNSNSLAGVNMGFVGYLYDVYSWALCMIVFMVGFLVFMYMYNILMYLYS